MNRKHFILIAAVFLISSRLFAATSFSGYAGAKLNYSPNPESEDYDPDLKLQAFFAGQFNFSQNVWSHLEFSINTGDFFAQSFFHETDSKFQVDELSLIMRANMYSCANYFSMFMGTYDPIGSDVFLQRYFNIKPISSKITESYLGLAGSILYPHFGIGISDIIKFYNKPIAFGGYLYVNHEDEDNYVFNADLRFATVLRFLTFDFAGGIGIPLSDKYKGEEVILAIEKIYWHAGTTMLLGNNYTTSLFLQAGIYNASFTKKQDSSVISPNEIYLLAEPRFLLGKGHLNISVFSLPPETVKKLLFVDDTLGVDVNIYGESSTSGSKEVNFGTHVCLSFIDKNFEDLQDIQNINSNGYNLNITPYFSTTFLSGELHLQGTLRIKEFINGNAGRGISVDLGYRTKF
ncbi:MAG: hypothetical protein J6X84_03370 [Treponema sp.]|nr:hypothetical protein [Treponema sp.]